MLSQPRCVFLIMSFSLVKCHVPVFVARSTNVAQRASSGSPPYDQLWVELKPTVTSLTLTVWAHEEAYVLLAENYDNRDIAMEVAIGVEGGL